MFFGRPWQEWVDQYQQSHENKINRLCHFVGIPMIILSILMFLIGFFAPDIWITAISLFILGWGLQFLGHVFEGKPPEFLQDWRFLFVGARWWYQKVVREKR